MSRYDDFVNIASKGHREPMVFAVLALAEAVNNLDLDIDEVSKSIDHLADAVDRSRE